MIEVLSFDRTRGFFYLSVSFKGIELRRHQEQHQQA